MPIFTLIGTAIAGALFGGSVFAATLIAGALAFGAKLAISYLNRPKARKYSAVQGETQFGGDVPVNALFGIGKVRGQRLFYAKFGEGNKYNTEVFALANGWCDGLEPYVYFYGQKYNLIERATIGNEVKHYETAEFGNNLSFRFYDGRPGQGVDAKLVSDSAALGQTWKSTSVCAGLTYVVVEREYDERFSKGRPDFDFVLRGLREYDPRKDSTVAGGSGPQRLGDTSTYVFTKNPAVHRLNYQLGLKGLVSGRTLIGEGKSIGQIDLATYFVAMNVCDTVKNGKPTYEAALFVNSDDDHTEVLKEFDDAMAGYALNRRGLSGIIAGAPQVPVLEITAEDIPIDRAQDLQRRKSAFDLFNHLSGQFTSKESQWGPESLTPIFVNADVTADGRSRQTSNDFLQVTDPDIAQYLLTIRYRQNRLGGSATVPVSRRVGLAVQEGEWITFDGTDWLITGWQCDEQFRFTLTLAETSADIYDDGDIEPGPIIIPPSAPINPSILSTVQNWRVEVGVVNGAGGQEVPALRFAWDPPNDPTIIAVRIFYYRDDIPDQVYQDTCDTPEDGIYITSKNVSPGVFYTARATITTVPDRFKTFTPWLTTATVTGDTFYPIDLDQLAQDVKDFQAWAGNAVRDVLDELRAVSANGAGNILVGMSDKQELRRELRSTTDGAVAQFTEQIIAATGPGSAIVLDISALQAIVNDPATGLVATSTAVQELSTTVTAQGGTITANSSAITALQTSYGDVSAGATFRMGTGYTPSAGWTSRTAFENRVTSGGTFRAAGIYLEATSTQARVLMDAQSFYFGDLSSGSAVNPLVFTSGQWYLGSIKIGSANIDNLAVTSHKTQRLDVIR
ncbi:phage tail protein [Mesorhizobium sp. B2-4-11]|uniref:phage tail tip fiber protein n=1 Tax=Mesorhizobium sp. B2-4-11 TaxID=2589938 RepID=UPI00112A64B4|nr:phage tail protein [Mesorhizobium sp. B2-4-11]TPL06693.1 phage tail protein [Mesorhizobium sp. B2-4-11]